MTENQQHETYLLVRTSSPGCLYTTVLRTRLVLTALVFCLLVPAGCRRAPVITFTEVPPDGLGGVDSRGVVSGRVANFLPGDEMMLFAFNGKWWVQPEVTNPRTSIARDGSWSAQIHLGHTYAAAVVRGNYSIGASADKLPILGDHVLALQTVHGTPTAVDRMDHTARTLLFGGQEWDDTFHESEYGGRPHYYLPQNATVDGGGHLHLKIVRVADQWTCSEVNVARSLGYGNYRITFMNPRALESAAEFSLFNMDVQAVTESYREMDFHVSRWGDPRSANAEFVLQPYYLPANVHSFEIPAGLITTTLRWSPGRAAFAAEADGRQIAAWTFTAGVPPPSDGRIYLNLCSFGYPKNPLQHEIEMIVNEFEYLP